MALRAQVPEFPDSLVRQQVLARTERWSAINSSTGNLAGLAAMAGELADAFAALPGEVTLEEPAPVTEIAPDGRAITLSSFQAES